MKKPTSEEELDEVAGISERVLSPDTKRLLERVLAAKPSEAQLSTLLLALSDHLDRTGTLARQLTEILPRT